MKRPICISIAGILVLSLFTGCSAAGQVMKLWEQTAREEQHRTEQEEESGDAGDSMQEDETEDLQALFDAGFPYHLNGRYVIQGEMIYFALNDEVYGYNQVTGESEVFPLNGDNYEMPKTYLRITNNRKLYLAGEYLYYLNRFQLMWEDRSESLLYQVDLSTGERRMDELPFRQGMKRFRSWIWKAGFIMLTRTGISHRFFCRMKIRIMSCMIWIPVK